jgi:hypothetical protein
MGETGVGFVVVLGAKHPWRGEAGATLGGQTRWDLAVVRPGIGRRGVGERADKRGPHISEGRARRNRGRKA